MFASFVNFFGLPFCGLPCLEVIVFLGLPSRLRGSAGISLSIVGEGNRAPSSNTGINNEESALISIHSRTIQIYPIPSLEPVVLSKWWRNLNAAASTQSTSPAPAFRLFFELSFSFCSFVMGRTAVAANDSADKELRRDTWSHKSFCLRW